MKIAWVILVTQLFYHYYYLFYYYVSWSWRVDDEYFVKENLLENLLEWTQPYTTELTLQSHRLRS